MKPITDLHAHLLPGFDDGAKSVDISLEMARQAAGSGVGRMVCTPHCSTADPRLAERAALIRRAVARMNERLSRREIPLTLFPGMELLCGENLPAVLGHKEALTLAGSRYLLIEFPFSVRLSDIEWAAEQVRLAGLTPVLAHPERYTAVQRDPYCLGDWFDSGYILQLDQDSILGNFGRHAARTAHWALDHGLAHAVSSDAHSIHTRAPDFQPVEELLSRRYSSAYAGLLLRRNPGRIVENRPVVAAG